LIEIGFNNGQKTKLKLAEALYNKVIVKFRSPYEQGSTDGYILDIGPRFFLLGLIDDYLKFNGFQCMRLSDVRRLRVPAPYAEFALAALRKQGQLISRKPRIDLDSLPKLLKSANRLFPLVTVHRERVDPDTCKIGRVTDINQNHLSLLEIGPDAVWDEKPSKVRLSEITRIDFGGGYEEALHLVGGKPKRMKKNPKTSLS
jgi:hypothetical protein